MWPGIFLSYIGIILFNTMLMALDGYGIPPAEEHVLTALNSLCTVIFIIEA